MCNFRRPICTSKRRQRCSIQMLLCSGAVLSEIIMTTMSDIDITMAQITESKTVAKCQLSYTLNLVTVLNFKCLFVFNMSSAFCGVFFLLPICLHYTTGWVWLTQADHDKYASGTIANGMTKLNFQHRADTNKSQHAVLLFTTLWKCAKRHKLHVDSSICAVCCHSLPETCQMLTKSEFHQKSVHA